MCNEIFIFCKMIVFPLSCFYKSLFYPMVRQLEKNLIIMQLQRILSSSIGHEYAIVYMLFSFPLYIKFCVQFHHVFLNYWTIESKFRCIISNIYWIFVLWINAHSVCNLTFNKNNWKELKSFILIAFKMLIVRKILCTIINIITINRK